MPVRRFTCLALGAVSLSALLFAVHSSAETTPGLPTSRVKARPVLLKKKRPEAPVYSPLRVVHEQKEARRSDELFGELCNVPGGVFEEQAFVIDDEVEIRIPDIVETENGKLIGRWPDAIFFNEYQAGNGTRVHAYDSKRKRWAVKYKGMTVPFATTWKRGSLLGLKQVTEHDAPGYYSSQYSFIVLSGAVGAPSAPQIRGKNTCGMEARVLDFQARPSGEVYVLVQDCVDQLPPYELNLQYWDRSGRRRKFILPESERLNLMGKAQLALHSGGNVYGILNAAGRQRNRPWPYLFRFDGQKVHLLRPPTKDRLQSIATGPDGTLWLISGERLSLKLWEYEPATGRGVEVPMPRRAYVAGSTRYRPRFLRGYVDGIWVHATHTRSGHAVLWTRRE